MKPAHAAGSTRLLYLSTYASPILYSRQLLPATGSRFRPRESRAVARLALH